MSNRWPFRDVEKQNPVWKFFRFVIQLCKRDFCLIFVPSSCFLQSLGFNQLHKTINRTTVHFVLGVMCTNVSAWPGPIVFAFADIRVLSLILYHLEMENFDLLRRGLERFFERLGTELDLDLADVKAIIASLAPTQRELLLSEGKRERLKIPSLETFKLLEECHGKIESVRALKPHISRLEAILTDKAQHSPTRGITAYILTAYYNSRYCEIFSTIPFTFD